MQLRFDVAASRAFDDTVRARLTRLARRRMTADGTLVIEAKRYRRQERNREDAIARLAALVRKAATPPRPRRKTRVPAGSRKKRLENKARRGDTKRSRARVKKGED